MYIISNINIHSLVWLCWITQQGEYVTDPPILRSLTSIFTELKEQDCMVETNSIEYGAHELKTPCIYKRNVSQPLLALCCAKAAPSRVAGCSTTTTGPFMFYVAVFHSTTTSSDIIQCLVVVYVCDSRRALRLR